jgi:hypothetical protein
LLVGWKKETWKNPVLYTGSDECEASSLSVRWSPSAVDEMVTGGG